MTEQRFNEILQAYGADAARWPQAERAAALAYLAAHAGRLAPALAAASELDAVLGPAGQPAGELLQRRILRHVPEAGRAWRARAPWAAAAALLIGAFLGFAGGALLTPEPALETYYMDAFTGLDQDWVDWLGGDA